ncbi:MAG: response regulator, partial [Mariprofundaceae bacterium]|nr:response regulator [Mariprofundaceae bacterium]
FKVRTEGIDLVILDVVMPVMGGGVAAQCIRQINPHAKIILSTGYDRDSRTDMDNEAVLSKPFSIAEMSHLIRRQLDGSEVIR